MNLELYHCDVIIDILQLKRNYVENETNSWHSILNHMVKVILAPLLNLVYHFNEGSKSMFNIIFGKTKYSRYISLDKNEQNFKFCFLFFIFYWKREIQTRYFIVFAKNQALIHIENTYKKLINAKRIYYSYIIFHKPVDTFHLLELDLKTKKNINASMIILNYQFIRTHQWGFPVSDKNGT